MIERFFIENQSQVKRNDTLGILKNTASLEDVQTFCNVLTNIEWYYRTNDINYLQDYPFNLIMGEMAPAYEQFTQAVRTCVMYQEFDLYPQKKKFLDDELKILNESKQANALEILKVKREEFELEINHKMEMGKNRRMLELAYENMVNSLRTWENKYLIKSRHDGIVVWGKSWGMSHRVNEGDTLCTVISKQQANPLGHIRLSQDEVAEVAGGDKVNIELNKYPTHSYGVLPGKIASISFVPYNKSYAVEVAFPEGLTTTNHKEIKYEIESEPIKEEKVAEKSVEYTKEFEEMYMQLFGTKPVKGEKYESKIDDSNKIDDIAKLENRTVFENIEEYQKPTYKFVGILFDEYIIIEMEKEMYIIDQHSAHEKILFEKLKDNYYDIENKDSQLMLLPDIITLSRKQMEIARDNMQMFRNAGFMVEEFGENTVKITGVPEICLELETREIFTQILDEIDKVSRNEKQEVEQKFISTLAFKIAKDASIANTKEEVDGLMNELLILNNPFTGPLGEPIAIKMSKYDIERKFARK